MDQKIGSEVEVYFPQLKASMKGKVDTGATTSSLHATNIKRSKDGKTVSFVSPDLSKSVITASVAGEQQVQSADGGTQPRLTIALSVDINGVSLPSVEINLNDRGEMTHGLLVGQDMLKAGNFVVDVNESDNTKQDVVEDVEPVEVDRSNQIREAIRVLRESNITLAEIMKHIQTEVVNTLDQN